LDKIFGIFPRLSATAQDSLHMSNAPFERFHDRFMTWVRAL
jgi:hypothetical protein